MNKNQKKKECRWSVLPCCFSSWCNCGFSELQVAPNSITHVEYELAKIGHSWDGWPSLNSMFEAPYLSARDASDGKSLQLTSPKWLTELLAQKHGKATDWSAHIPVWLTPSMSKWWSTISFPLHRSEWVFWGLTQIGLCFTACMGWFFDRAGMITCTELRGFSCKKITYIQIVPLQSVVLLLIYWFLPHSVSYLCVWMVRYKFVHMFCTAPRSTKCLDVTGCPILFNKVSSMEVSFSHNVS